MKFGMNVHSLRLKTTKLANSHKSLIEEYIKKQNKDI